MNEERTDDKLIDLSDVAAEPGPPHDVPGLPLPGEVDPDAVAPEPASEDHHLATSVAGLVSGYPVERAG